MKTRSAGLRQRAAKTGTKRKKHRQIFSNAFLRLLRRTCQLLATLAGIPAVGLIAAAFYLNNALPDTYYLEDPSTFALAQYRILEPVAEQQATVQTLVGTVDPEAEAEKMQGSISGKEDGQSIEYTLMLGGVIPVKTVTAVQSEARYVIPSGSVFGLKMLTDGAVVASLSPVETASGTVCPAELAGIQSGDIILTANGQQINSFDTLSSVISAAGENGQPVQITYSRDNTEKQTTLSPVQTTDGQWLAGMWVRDSSAGIGTITFYEPYTGCFAALGHGVCDADTGVLLPLQWGSVCGATVLGVTRGVTGTPGELQGAFLDSAFTLSSLLGKDGMISSGTVLGNYSCGLIVRADSSSILSTSGIQTEQAMMEVCPRQEVHTGEAKILSTIGGTQPQLFDAQIEKVSFSDDDTSRNIVIQITDPDLIAATGGIVQGMSGSPILQNGKLVGAVTHVFVSDPEKGYGIFAETMLDALDNTVEESKAG